MLQKWCCQKPLEKGMWSKESESQVIFQNNPEYFCWTKEALLLPLNHLSESSVNKRAFMLLVPLCYFAKCKSRPCVCVIGSDFHDKWAYCLKQTAQSQVSFRATEAQVSWSINMPEFQCRQLMPVSKVILTCETPQQRKKIYRVDCCVKNISLVHTSNIVNGCAWGRHW